MERVRRAAEAEAQAAEDRRQMAAVVARLPQDRGEAAEAGAEVANGTGDTAEHPAGYAPVDATSPAAPDEPGAEQTEVPEPAPDPNFVTVNAILERLGTYGIKPSIEGPYQLVLQAQVHAVIRALIAAGIIDEAALDAEVWAQTAGNLRSLLQQVEEQRLQMAEAAQQAKAQAARQVQPVRGPDLILPRGMQRVH